MEGNNHDPHGQDSNSHNGERIPPSDENGVTPEHLDFRPNGNDGRIANRDGSNGDISSSSDREADNQQGSPREIELEVTEQLLATLQTSGPVPDSGQLYSYTPEHQERIFRMAESSRTDESVRRDIMVNSQTQIAWVTVWIQSILVVGTVGVTAILFWLTRDPVTFVLLSLPVMQAIGSIGRRNRRRSNSE